MMLADDISLDLHDAGGIDHAMQMFAPDCVIHLAGTRNRGGEIGDYHENYQANLLNSLNLLHSCLKLKSLKRFVFIGSCDEYGSCEPPFHEGLREQPNNAYGLSKLATTQLLAAWHHLQDFPVVVLRPSVVYGPGQGSDMFIPSLAMALASGRTFGMTKGEQIRDFIFVEDLVEAIVMAAIASKRVEGKVMNIGSGTPVRIREVALMVADLLGPDAYKLLRIGELPYRPYEVMNYSLLIDRAADVLGWYPMTTLEEGLKRTLAHITANGGKS
jgi:nucleoside-diphosphate-sugar epimerase